MPSRRPVTPLASICLSVLAAMSIGVRAADAPAIAASTPMRVVTDIAHWQHPVKDVFLKYGLPLQQVTLQGRHATFRVAFPFDPQTQPNEATMNALYADLLRANGDWGYTLESLQDGLAIDVSFDRRTRRISVGSHRL